MAVVSLNSTQLTSRVLWYDGDSTIKADDLLQVIKTSQPHTNIFVDKITEEIEAYNRNGSDQQFKVKTKFKELDTKWNLSSIYKNIDIAKHIADLLVKECINNQWPISSIEYSKRKERVAHELKLYENKNLLDVLRALIYIINTLEDNNVVWGVGRGSSVSSYILYLFKVHDVDSCHYNLDISDFLRT